MKPKIAVYWTGSCGGCDVSFLEVGEAIVDILSQVEIAFWPALADAKRADLEAMPRGYIDAALINGTIRTEENVEMVRLLREKSKLVVAYGACAHLGGVPSLANLASREEVLQEALGQGWRPGPPPGAPREDAPPELLPQARVESPGQEGQGGPGLDPFPREPLAEVGFEGSPPENQPPRFP